MKVCEEMQSLRDWLDNNDIKWEDMSEDWGRYLKDFNGEFYDHWMVRTHFKLDGVFVSVINGFGSYGGYYLYEKDNKGLLEVMVNNNNEPIGYLTHQGVIEILNEIKENKNGMD